MQPWQRRERPVLVQPLLTKIVLQHRDNRLSPVQGGLEHQRGHNACLLRGWSPSTELTVGSSRMRKLGCPARTAASCRRRRSPPLSDLTCRVSGLQTGKRVTQLIRPLEREATGVHCRPSAGRAQRCAWGIACTARSCNETQAVMADLGAPPAGVADSWRSPAVRAPPLQAAPASAAPLSSEPSSCRLPPCGEPTHCLSHPMRHSWYRNMQVARPGGVMDRGRHD